MIYAKDLCFIFIAPSLHEIVRQRCNRKKLANDRLHLSFFRSIVANRTTPSPLTLLSTNYKTANQSTMMSLVKESVGYRSTVVRSYTGATEEA